MEASLKDYVASKYPATKTDLFATFILRCLELCNSDGLTGYMTPFVWMFISSYEKLRTEIIENHFINNLIQLEYSGFDGATVPICTFTLRNQLIENAEGSYIRLSDFKGAKLQAPKTLEAIQNPNCGWFYTVKQENFSKIPKSIIAYSLSNRVISSFELDTISSCGKAVLGMNSTNNELFTRLWFEIADNKFKTDSVSHNDTINSAKWFPYNKGGEYRRWYGNRYYVLNWENKGEYIHKRNKIDFSHQGAPVRGKNYQFKESISWSFVTSGNFAVRYTEEGAMFDVAGSSVFVEKENQMSILAFLNSCVATHILKVLAPTLNFQVGNISSLPIARIFIQPIQDVSEKCVTIARLDWNSRETSWDFEKNEIIKHKADTLEESYDGYKHYWKNKFFQLHKNEEELNKQFIDIYGLQDELTPDVPLEDITILKEETDIVNGELVFDAKEVLIQFISYAVGCMFGRYSLDKEGLILANQGETLEDYLEKVALSEAEVSFLPDDDNIIPVLDDEWFEDDIVGRFYEFLKVTFGAANFDKNLAFVEDCIGKDIRKFFVKDFYNDHIKRYKKRPIYWMFSSPKGAFNVLIYMHRYTPDTLSQILNGYLVEYREKLNTRMEHLDHLIESGSSSEQTKAAKEKDKLKAVLLELQEYEREVLYPLATERIAIDLDDGVLVNYNKFGKAIKEVKGLNDKKAKDKVMKFDWIDTTTIK